LFWRKSDYSDWIRTGSIFGFVLILIACVLPDLSAYFSCKSETYNPTFRSINLINPYFMKGAYLGELEELLMLMVGILYPEAYGVAVMDELERQTGRSINISAVHSVLTRLEDKGMLKSSMSEPREERGGRRKRIFHLTAAGKRALEEANELRNQLYGQIPKVVLQYAFKAI
jgi:DNA-binding PadR family transcriptional regulator